MPKHTYKVQGMHCKSCEILIERKISGIAGVKSAEASTGRGEVAVECSGEKPDIKTLNRIFEKDNYEFSEQGQSFTGHKGVADKKSSWLIAFNIAIFIIIGFLILDKSGVAGVLSVNSTSSLLAFLGFGLLASVSSCAALVGGIVLSMSQRWGKSRQPHILFNFGRMASYAFFGGILGLVGGKLQISPQVSAFLIVTISLLMIALGLQMLGARAFRKFQIALPKSFTSNIADESKYNGKYGPFLMGALTFFLPCGFTITAQSLALLSGNALSGALIMGAFALGTAPVFLLIGLFSVKFYSKPHLAERFSRAAGFLVLFFALFNINAQMNVLGYANLDSILGGKQEVVTEKGLPPLVNGKQIIKMEASSSEYSPSYFKVKAGIPVRWEIKDIGTSGCTNAVISKNLFDGQIELNRGEVAVKEFTPQKAGKYKFSCWMGMVSGIIEVVN